MQRQRGQKHAKVESAGKSQLKFEVTAGSVQVNCSDAKRILSNEEQIAHAEILCVVRSVQHDHAFRSSDDLVPVLRAAFDDPIVNETTLCASKVSYSQRCSTRVQDLDSSPTRVLFLGTWTCDLWTWTWHIRT